MPAKTLARPLSNLRGPASLWDACFFVMSSGRFAALNRRSPSCLRHDFSAKSAPGLKTGIFFPDINPNILLIWGTRVRL
jgi:hypothetical protein